MHFKTQFKFQFFSFIVVLFAVSIDLIYDYLVNVNALLDLELANGWLGFVPQGRPHIFG